MTTAQPPARRRFIRHPARVPIKCRKVGHDDALMNELRNIGNGGLAFVSQEEYEPGDVLEINFLLPDAEDGLKGEIMWSGPLDENDQQPDHTYINGLKFMDEATRFHARLVEQICHIDAYCQAQREKGRNLDIQTAAEEWITLCAPTFPE